MRFLGSLMLVAIVFAVRGRAQVIIQAHSEIRHFEKGDLAFDFPADWKLKDFGTADSQRIGISTEDHAVQMGLFAELGNNDQCDFLAASKGTTNNLLSHLATQINDGHPLPTSPVTTRVGVSEIDGLQFRGQRHNRPVIGEIYWVRLNQHFVILAYICGLMMTPVGSPHGI